MKGSFALAYYKSPYGLRPDHLEWSEHCEFYIGSHYREFVINREVVRQGVSQGSYRIGQIVCRSRVEFYPRQETIWPCPDSESASL